MKVLLINGSPKEHGCTDLALSEVARTLRETTTRVPFSDWYDTKTGRYEHFIARSVQGGIYALLLQ